MNIWMRLVRPLSEMSPKRYIHVGHHTTDETMQKPSWSIISSKLLISHQYQPLLQLAELYVLADVFRVTSIILYLDSVFGFSIHQIWSFPIQMGLKCLGFRFCFLRHCNCYWFLSFIKVNENLNRVFLYRNCLLFFIEIVAFCILLFISQFLFLSFFLSFSQTSFSNCPFIFLFLLFITIRIIVFVKIFIGINFTFYILSFFLCFLFFFLFFFLSNSIFQLLSVFLVLVL